MDLLFHVLLPALVLLALRVRARYAIGLAPLAVLPDLDGLSEAGHRIYGHNVFIVLFVVLAAYFLARLWVDGKEARHVGLVAGFFVVSHLVLDLADPSGWLYPLTDRGFHVTMGIVGDFRATPHLYYPILQAGSVAPEGAWSYPQLQPFEKDAHVAYMISPQAIQLVLLAGLGLALFGRPLLAQALHRLRRGVEEPAPAARPMPVKVKARHGKAPAPVVRVKER